MINAVVKDMEVKHKTTKSDFELSIPKAKSVKPYEPKLNEVLENILTKERPNDKRRYPVK